MELDLSPLLDDWPYDPREDLMVRRIAGPQGQARLQIRIELGLLEMHLEGRPDGSRPEGHESLLDFHLDRIRQEMSDDGVEPFELDHDECLELQRESMQYYHRRLAWLKTGEYASAATDAEHNLAVMDLLRDRAADRADWLASEQYRSFVLSHLTRAKMLAHLTAKDVDGAVQAVEDGIDTIEKLFRDEYRRADLIDRSDELRSLKELRRGLMTSDVALQVPSESEQVRLERELVSAVGDEDFERAARIRDRLTAIRRSS